MYKSILIYILFFYSAYVDRLEFASLDDSWVDRLESCNIFGDGQTALFTGIVK